MGHSNQRLQRTRCVNLRGLNIDVTRRFWQSHAHGTYTTRAWHASAR